MYIAACICLTIFALASFVGAVYACLFAVRVSREVLNSSEAVYREAAVVARSQQEASTKYTSVMTQVAMLISKQVDERVRERVKTINAIRNPSIDDDEPLEDAPPAHDVYTSLFLDDETELKREERRFRRDGNENIFVRDNGIGVEDL